MPFKTPYGKHYHLIEGCHGATIPCNADGLEPCSDCCWGSASAAGAGTGAGTGVVIGGSAAGEYTIAVTGDRESRDTCDVLVLSDRVSSSEVAAVVVTTSGRSLLKGKRTGDIKKWDTKVMAMSEAELQAFRSECAKLGRGAFPHGDDVAGILRSCVSEDAILAEERGGKAPLAALNDILLDVSTRRLGYQSGPRGTDYRPVQIEAAQRREARKAAKDDGYDFDDDDRGYRVDEDGRVRYPMDLRSLGHSAPLNVQMYVRVRDIAHDRARAEADRDRRNPY